MARTNNSIMTRARLRIAAILVLVCGSSVLVQSNATNFVLLPSIKTDVSQESLMLDAAASGERTLIVGEQGHILYSDDNGSSWTHADVPVSLAITAVTFASPGNAWATAHDGHLLQSTDNGASWKVKLTGTDVARLSLASAEERVKVLEATLEQAAPDAREDVEWALDDATFAVEDATAAIDEGITTPLLNVWFASDNDGYALGAYGVFLQTTDGGTTWSLETNRLKNPDNYHLYAMARSSAGTLLLAGEAGTVLRSRDGGETFEPVTTSYSGSFFGAVATNDGSLLVYGLRGNVFRSTDDGDSWSAIDTGDERTLLGGMKRADGTIVLVGSAGAVLVSTDNGRSFKAIPTTGNKVYSGVTETADGGLLLVGFGGVSFVDSTAATGASS